MSTHNFDTLCLRIHELKEEYQVFRNDTRLLLEKTIEFYHFGELSTMSSEENIFWRRMSTETFYNTIKHVDFMWDTELEGSGEVD
jgi:hypothetical protein